MHNMNGMQWGMGVGWLILAGILFITVWIIARYVYPGNRPQDEEKKSALNILKERYARGEIGREEYLDKKKQIS